MRDHEWTLDAAPRGEGKSSQTPMARAKRCEACGFMTSMSAMTCTECGACFRRVDEAVRLVAASDERVCPGWDGACPKGKMLSRDAGRCLSCAARKSNAAKTPEQRSEAGRKGNASMTTEQRSETARKSNAAKTPEQRSEAGRKGHATRRDQQSERP